VPEPDHDQNNREMLLHALRRRGIVKDFTDKADVHLEQGPTAIYCGFDPTADSLQLGNLIPIMQLKRFQEAGHRPIIVVGGGTGMIGDPSGKSAERPMADPVAVERRAEKFARQFQRFLDFGSKANGAILVNNASWLKEMNVVDFMWEVGKRLSAKRIVGLESIKARWERDAEGISLAEFVYTALQAYDFAHLYRELNCTVQCGGSDQYGNIALGTELVRKMINGAQVFGVTFPLISDRRGVKLGKTADEQTIWLDPTMTSPFFLRQYLLQTADDDAKAWLSYLTLLGDERIAEIAAEHDRAPERRLAQASLADEVTQFIHGRAEADKARRQGEILFSDRPGEVQADDLRDLAKEPGLAIHGTKQSLIVDLIVQAKLATSKREARDFLKDGGIYWNGEKVRKDGPINELPTIHDSFAILRRGSRNVKLVVVEPRPA
jgi:tyrosyl-tRNA synthetase